MFTGENIKKIRINRDISRKKLADSIEKDELYLKLVEEEGLEVSVSELLKIANILDTDISSLMDGLGLYEKGVVITREDSRTRVERKTRLDYESLAPHYSGRHIEPFLVEIKENDIVEYSSHEGEEFHYVMSGVLKIVVDDKEYILQQGDTIYFDSSFPHALSAVGEKVKILAAIYNSSSMTHLARSRKMADLIQGAKIQKSVNIVIVIPNDHAIDAVNRAMEELVVANAYIIGDPDNFPVQYKNYIDNYKIISVDSSQEGFEVECAEKGVELIKNGHGQMLMKGNINTAVFMKSILNKKSGIGTGRRLSLVSIFELPKLNRFIFLTDPGINTELTVESDISTSKDIILNAIDVSRSMGISRPKVAILDANEKTSEKIPTSIFAKQLSEMTWENADVFGPLSYDLALYEESVKEKGITGNVVAGNADILIVPHLAGGNFLYKAWAMTMSADVANVVLGAKVPVIITSRSDSDMTKFLSLCASAVYSAYNSEG
ncbi:MAG: cupin domain-containing protein [Spirochaetales bacterium]|nr:cupin domain-containing protein [Spirochaetales bacterium]